MTDPESPQALADRLDASLNKAAQVSTTLAQFAEILVPAMSSFQSSLRENAVRGGDIAQDVLSALQDQVMSTARLDGIEARLDALAAQMAEPSDAGREDRLQEPLNALSARIDALDRRLGEMADRLGRDLSGSLTPPSVASLPDLLNAAEGRIAAQLNTIEANRFAEQPAGFIGRLEDRLRRVESALGVIAGAVVEVMPVRKTVASLEEKIIALEARTISPEQAAGLGAAMATIGTLAGTLSYAADSVTSAVPALTGVREHIERNAGLLAAGEAIHGKMASAAEMFLSFAPVLTGARDHIAALGEATERLGAAAGVLEAATPDLVGLPGAVAQQTLTTAALTDLIARLGQAVEAIATAAPMLGSTADHVERAAQLIATLDAVSGQLAGAAQAVAAAVPGLAAFTPEMDKARRLFKTLEGVSAKLSSATDIVAESGPSLADAARSVADAAALARSRTEPLEAIAQSLSDAAATYARQPDAATVADSVGVSVATHLAAQLAAWAQTLEARIDTAATGGATARAEIETSLAGLKDALSSLGARIDGVTKAVGSVAPDLSPVLDRLDLVETAGRDDRSASDLALVTIQAALGQLGARIETLSTLVGGAKPDLTPLIARLDAAASLQGEGRAEIAATLSTLKTLLGQVSGKVDLAAARVAEARLSARDPADDEALFARIVSTIDSRLSSALDRLDAPAAKSGEAAIAPADLLSQAASLEIAEAVVRLERRIEEVIGAPGERIVSAVRSLQDLGERMRTLDARAEAMVTAGSTAAEPVQARLAEAVATINGLAQRFNTALRKLERKLTANGKSDADSGQAEVTAIAAQLRENTAEFIAIGAALSKDIARLSPEPSDKPLPVAKAAIKI